MSRYPFVAGVLSLLAPGLGQIYAGKGERGSAILVAAVFIANLNAIWLCLFATSGAASGVYWASTLPRLLHDIAAAWAVIFWLWAIVDAYQQAKRRTP